jgi:hypothetical protein
MTRSDGFFFMPALFKAQNGLEIHQNKKHGARPEAREAPSRE